MAIFSVYSSMFCVAERSRLTHSPTPEAISEEKAVPAPEAADPPPPESRNSPAVCSTARRSVLPLA